MKAFQIQISHYLHVTFFVMIGAAVFGQSFTGLQTEVNLNHVYDPRAHIGGGAVIIDINNDGFMDVYLPGGKGSEQLLLNNNGESFTNIAADAGLWVVDNFYTVGGVAGDVNNDGFEDLFVTTWQFVETFGNPNFNALNLLLLNNGDNTFTNSGGMAGILGQAFSASANLLDINHDGFLDIYVVNYVEQTSLMYDDQTGQVIGFSHDCFDNYLYVNVNGFSYENQAELYGVNDPGCGLAAAGTDFNADGNTDLMVVNDFGQWVSPNKLYQHTGSGFADVSEEKGASLGFYGMGIAVGDYDEDGDMDYYMTNMGRNILLRQEASGPWLDVTTEANVENTHTGEVLTSGWGTFFFDYDNDSYLDLYVSNGHIPSAPFITNALYDPNKLYRNNQDGTFTDVTIEENLLDTAMGRGAVYFDFNNDGLLDILQVNIYDPMSSAPNGTILYLNETQNDNNYVMFALSGVTANPHGIGARVELHAAGRVLIREVDGGSSHASHNDKRVHFGLGAMNAIDSVVVYWPGNPHPQIVHDPAINEIHEIVQEDVITSTPGMQHEGFINRVYPNPASGPLYVELNPHAFGELQLELTDLSGKIIFRKTSIVPASGMLSLDNWSEQLSAGVYLLSISNGNQKEVVRVVIAD